MPTGDASQLSVDHSLNMLQHSAITNTAGFFTGNPPYSIPPDSAASREKQRAVTTALTLRLMARLTRSVQPAASVRLSLLDPDVGRVEVPNVSSGRRVRRLQATN